MGVVGPGEEGWSKLQGQPCTPVPGYRSDLPDTVDEMRQLLQTTGLLRLLGDVFMAPAPVALPPLTEAALFEALADLPGVTVVQPVVDAAGRSGVAMSWQQGGSTLRLVFDPAGYTYRSVQIIEAGKRAPSLEDTIVQYEIVDSIPPQPESTVAPTRRPGGVEQGETVRCGLSTADGRHAVGLDLSGRDRVRRRPRPWRILSGRFPRL